MGFHPDQGFLKTIMQDFKPDGTRRRGKTFGASNMLGQSSGKYIPQSKMASKYQATSTVVDKETGEKSVEPNRWLNLNYHIDLNRLCDLLCWYIQQYIPSFPRTAIDYDWNISWLNRANGKTYADGKAPIEKNARWVRYADVYIDQDAMWRDSLWNSSENGAQNMNKRRPYWNAERGKYGVNIVRLFEFGWHANGGVRGVWHGIEVWSRPAHKATYMLSNAIKVFNQSTNRGVTATLRGKYNS